MNRAVLLNLPPPIVKTYAWLALSLSLSLYEEEEEEEFEPPLL